VSEFICCTGIVIEYTSIKMHIEGRSKEDTFVLKCEQTIYVLTHSIEKYSTFISIRRTKGYFASLERKQIKTQVFVPNGQSAQKLKKKIISSSSSL
jgi:hypothetical protein